MEYSDGGSLVITKNEDSSGIEGTGQLALFDQLVALIHFDLEEKTPMNICSILGLVLVPELQTYKPYQNSVPVNGVKCKEVSPNIG